MHASTAEDAATGLRGIDPGQPVSAVESTPPDAPVHRDQGALELFIREFNDFEAGADLFARCRDEEGFAWWDLVRYTLQFQLCVEKGIHANAPAGKKPLVDRARSFLRQAGLLARDTLTVARLRGKGIEAMYVFSRRSRHLLEEVGSSPSPCLVVGDSDGPFASHATIRKGSIDFLVRIASNLVRIPKAVAAECQRLEGELRPRFGTRIAVRSIVLRKYRQHRAARIVWSLILSRLEALERVGFVGDDTLKSLVHLANARKIRTREFQHGYMGRSHVNYSYPDLSAPLSTLPDEVLVYRDSGDINYPVTAIRANAGAAIDASELAPARDIDVLVGGSPTRASEAIAIVEALADRGLALAIKLHPAQSEASSGIRMHFTSAQVRVYTSEQDFSSLARRARVYVPANPTSTTSFEAVEAGASLVVVDYAGAKTTSMLDGLVSGRVDAVEDLYGAVLPLLGRRAGHAVPC